MEGGNDGGTGGAGGVWCNGDTRVEVDRVPSALDTSNRMSTNITPYGGRQTTSYTRLSATSWCTMYHTIPASLQPLI